MNCNSVQGDYSVSQDDRQWFIAASSKEILNLSVVLMPEMTLQSFACLLSMSKRQFCTQEFVQKFITNAPPIRPHALKRSSGSYDIHSISFITQELFVRTATCILVAPLLRSTCSFLLVDRWHNTSVKKSTITIQVRMLHATIGGLNSA